jgi:hypothetical protein
VANLDDIVTVLKNGVVAMNDLTAALNSFRQIYTQSIGDNTYLGATDSNLVYTGAGRLVNVIFSGTAGGTIHDAATVATATTSNVIYNLPTTNPGLYQVNVPFFNGLVIRPNTGVTLSLTYSES